VFSPAAGQALFLAIFFAGCSGGAELFLPDDGEPAAIEIVHGHEQSGRVGEPLADSLVFEVTDSRGRPVEGAAVVVELTSSGPGADVVPDTARTDAIGQAFTRVVLGTTTGPHQGEARLVVPEGVEAPTADFTVIALPENANGIVASSGDNQTGPAGSVLGQPLVVEVTDAFGNPIPGVSITWTAEGGGSVSERSNVTDRDGRASVLRTLGPAAGPQATVATSDVAMAGSPVTFVHTATAGNASGLTIISGNNQTAHAGTRLPADLVVRLVDASGNGVPGAAVTWVVGTGGGSVTPENGTTDLAGQTSAQWTLGPNPGSNRVDAVVSGVGVVNFLATGTVNVPASLAIVTQPSPSARNGQVLERQPVVQVRDVGGTPTATPGVAITAQLSGGGGQLLGTTQRLTDASGRATFTDLAISGAEGPRILVFTAAGYAGASSAPVTVTPIPTTTTITSDSPDPSVAGAAVSVAFRVDAQGVIPTGTVTVTDGVQSCSGTLSGGSGSCQLTLSNPGQRTLRASYARSPGLNASSDTEEHTVNSSGPPPPPPPPPPGNEAPDADYNFHCEDLTCDFTDRSDDDDGRVVTWSWNFGDGTPASPLQNPTHTYVNPGSYTVTLTVTDDRGAIDASSATVRADAPEPPPPGGTNTTITADTPDPSQPGQAVTVSFTVTSSSGTPTGTVTVTDERGGGCTGQAPSGSCNYVPPGTGTRTITARYEGTAGFNGSSGAAQHTVSEPPPPEPTATTTTITGDNPDPSNPDQEITVSFIVTSPGGTPTGNVRVTDANGGGCNGDAPFGSCSYRPNGTGNRTITATYEGNSDFRGSAATETHTVTQPPPPAADTDTDITSDNPDPSAPGQAITVGFRVTSNGGTPTGTVTVSDEIGGSCSATVEQGSCSYTPSGTGQRTITATYAGNSSFNGSSATEGHTVSEPEPADTDTDITSDLPDPSDLGQPITVNFTVTSGGGAPSGTVTVSDEIGGSCSATVEQGSCSYTPSGSGSRTITASYAGNSSFEGSSDTESHNVNDPPPASTVTQILGIDPEPSDPGVPVTVSFSVTSPAGTPTGTVVITDANGGSCSGQAPSDSCSYTPSGTGARTVTAQFQGNASFQGSSGGTQHTVNGPNGASVAVIGSITCTGMHCEYREDSTDPDGRDRIESYRWVFGDGESANTPSASHDYTSAGQYTVTLTVTDDHQASSTSQQELLVSPPAGRPARGSALIAKAGPS
jgi:PKD repeat protein